jgi:hypothetical protein
MQFRINNHFIHNNKFNLVAKLWHFPWQFYGASGGKVEHVGKRWVNDLISIFRDNRIVLRFLRVSLDRICDWES